MKSGVLRLLLIWMSTNVDSLCRKVGERLKWPTLQAFIIPCGTKSARIGPPNTLTDSNLRFCRKLNRISILRLGHSNPNHILLHHRSITCYNNLVGSLHYLITFMKYTLFYYIVELYPILTHCWGLPYLFTMLNNSHFQYISELYPISVHCGTMANLNILLSACAKRCRQRIRIEHFVTR